jgi:predicted Zn-dependent protease
LSNRSRLYCHVLFYSFFIFSTQLLHHTFSPIAAVAERGPENDSNGHNDGDNADEDFEEQNTIKICCSWGHNLLDGILTYYTDTESSTKRQQDDVRDAVQEWDRNIDPLKLEETFNEKDGDILIEFQEEYEGNGREERAVGQSINKFDNSSFIDKVQIIVYRGTSEYKFDEDMVQRIVEHELGHALGLGHANFDGNLMAEKVNDGTEDVSECEVKAVLKANYWKLIADGSEPVMSEKNGVVCTE